MNVIVIGAGAAGLMAAGQAAAQGASVTLLEKNRNPGKKLLITGKGRCNITNIENMPDFIKYIPGNGQFLYSALTKFSNWDVVAFFNEHSVETKEERGGRIFPVSDKASDVVDALVNFCRSNNVQFIYDAHVSEITAREGQVAAVRLADGREFTSDAVIVAVGGASYPSTGSTGDGYKMARQLGHTVVTPKPALVPLETAEDWVKELQGLSLKNVEAAVIENGRKTSGEFGEMLFTHFGISGPIILTLSRSVVGLLEKGRQVAVRINLKPALTPEQLDARIQRDFSQLTNKMFRNSLNELLPKSMIPVIIRLSGIHPDKPVHQVTKEERLRLVGLLQGFEVTVTGPRPLREAIVTAGGVSVKEIDPRTMESKLVKGLYFAGEVADIDGYTGGFNLQAAFSMGYVAGTSAAGE